MRSKINKVELNTYKIIVKKTQPQLYNFIIIDAVRHELLLNIFCPKSEVWYDLYGE